MTTTHKLKTWPIFFQAIVEGKKTFEVRKDDRKFKVGDLLDLQEWDVDTQEYTGRSITTAISYKMTGEEWGVLRGYCVLGLSTRVLPWR